jgi:hypothetical protein
VAESKKEVFQVKGDDYVLVKIILNINNYMSQIRLANSLGDNPGIGRP